MQTPPLPPKAPEWSTRIPSRRPEFKFHKNRGQALNAVTGAGHGTIYKLVDGEWQVMWDGAVPSYHYSNRTSNRPTTCQQCGKSTLQTFTSNQIERFGTEYCSRPRNEGSYEWRRSETNKSKIVEPLERIWVCKDCR